MKTALLIHYTLTGEARHVVDIAANELALGGFSVTTACVDFADPALRLHRPLAPKTIKRWIQAAEAGEIFPIAVEPESALAGRYDLACIVSNTWQYNPSVPIRSLLARPDMHELLKGTAFAVYVVCRRSWENNLAVVRREAEQSGGRFIGGEHFAHNGGNVGSLIRTVSYLTRTGARVARLCSIRLPLPEYGLSSTALQRAGEFTRELIRSVGINPQ